MQVKLLKDELCYTEYDVSFLPTKTELAEFSSWLHKLTHSKVGIKMNGQIYRFSSIQERACFVYGLDYYLRTPIVLPARLSWLDRIKQLFGWKSKSDNNPLHQDGIDDVLRPHEHLAVPCPFFERVGVEVRAKHPVSLYALPKLELMRFENNLSFQDYDSKHHTCHDRMLFAPFPDEEWYLVIENTNESETEVNYRVSEASQ